MLFYSIPFFLIIFFLIIYIYWRFFFFFRDPDRIISQEDNIVSPADGTVVYIRKTSNDEIPISVKKGKKVLISELSESVEYKAYKEWYVVGIFMHPTSVHVNRAPIKGEVILVEHKQNKNFPMTLMWWKVLLGIKPYERGSTHVLKNERNTILIKGKNFPLYVVQIADIYVNKIVSYVKVGNNVEKGQRIGMIKFGSQVDFIFPVLPNIDIAIKEGEKVKAGESIMASLT